MVDSRSPPRFRGARLPARYRGAGEPSGTSRPTWPRCAPRRGPWAGPGSGRAAHCGRLTTSGQPSGLCWPRPTAPDTAPSPRCLDRPGINRAPLAPRRPRRTCRVAVPSSTPDSTPDVLRHLCPGGALSPRPCCRSPRRTVRRSSCPSPRDRSRRAAMAHGKCPSGAARTSWTAPGLGPAETPGLVAAATRLAGMARTTPETISTKHIESVRQYSFHFALAATWVAWCALSSAGPGSWRGTFLAGETRGAGAGPLSE